MNRLLMTLGVLLLTARTAVADERQYPPLPRGVSSLGAAVADGWLYVYGGHCGKTHRYSTADVVGTFRRLNLKDGKTWEELPGGPPAQGLALVAHGGKLYRIGGMQPRNAPGTKADNHSLRSVARFDPATKKWEDLAELPAGRSSHDAVVLGDKLYVVGGWELKGADQESRWHDAALVLDLKQASPRWEPVAQPFRRRALTATAHAGKVYVFGGLAAGAKAVPTVNVYDPAKSAWTTAPDIPGGGRNGFTPASCSAGGRLYVSPANGTIYRLSAAGDAWEEVAKLQQPRLVHRLVPVSDNLLVAVGGASQGENATLVEAVDLSRPARTASQR